MIYFIKTGEAVKIGYTTDIDTRLKAYRTHNPDITLLRIISGDKMVERYLHNALKAYRTTGEWFSYTTEVKQLITQPSLDDLYKEVQELERLSKDDSFRTYYNHGGAISKLKYTADMNIAIKFASTAKYNEGIVILTIDGRRELVTELKLHSSNISKSLKRLVEANIIHGGKGLYLLNPLYFWHGDTRGRNAILEDERFQIAFNFEYVK